MNMTDNKATIITLKSHNTIMDNITFKLLFTICNDHEESSKINSIIQEYINDVIILIPEIDVLEKHNAFAKANILRIIMNHQRKKIENH